MKLSLNWQLVSVFSPSSISVDPSLFSGEISPNFLLGGGGGEKIWLLEGKRGKTFLFSVLLESIFISHYHCYVYFVFS